MIDSSTLINISYTNPQDIAAFMSSIESWAYYEGNGGPAGPYPKYNFNAAIWPGNTPLPTPTKHVNIICSETAAFTVKNGAPTFSVPDNDRANIFLQEVIKSNFLNSIY